MTKKLSEFTQRITELLGTDRFMVARGTSGIDYYTTAEDIANFISNESGGEDFDESTDAWISASTGTYSTAELEALDSLVTYCKSTTIAAGGSLWDALSLLTICAVDNAADGQLNLKTAASTLTLIDSPTFTAREGFKLNGTTQFFGSGMTPSAITSDPEGFVGAYLRLNVSIFSNIVAWGRDNNSGNVGRQVQLNFSTSLFTSIHNGGQRSVSVGGEEQGCNSGSLTTTERIAVHNQVTSASARSTPNSPCQAQIYYGASQRDGNDPDGDSMSSNQYAAVWQGWGKGLTGPELEGFHAEIETCLGVFGAGVIE